MNIKGIVHPDMKTLPSFTHSRLFQSYLYMTFFLLWDNKSVLLQKLSSYLLLKHLAKTNTKLTGNCGCFFQVFIRTNELRLCAVFLSVHTRVSGSQLL